MSSKRQINVGVVFSTSGPYAAIGQELQNGALLALSQVNADPRFDFELVPVIRNPAGDLQDYVTICQGLLSSGTLRHVIGCYTSSSRKEVIPVFEKYDGLLWYPSHYEGFEHCTNVIYTGASPNQHIVPLMSYMIGHFGDQAYCVGSNYIWGWESNRILRESVTACGGSVISERYLPIGSEDVAGIVEEIIRLKPSYIFSSLIGVSSETFMRVLCAARGEDPALSPERMPVCSSTLSEPELARLSPASARGHIASSVYFQSRDTPQNRAFIAAYKARYGAEWVTSADAEAAFNACHLLALALHAAGSEAIEPVKRALFDVQFDAPQGSIWVDGNNNHCYLTPSIGLSNATGQFDILEAAPAPVRPDPYLVDFDPLQLIDSKKAATTLWSPHASFHARLRVLQ